MFYVSLTDAVMVLYEVSINVDEIRKLRSAGDQQQTAPLANTNLAKIVQHRPVIGINIRRLKMF